MTPLHLSKNQTELKLCALYAFLNNALGDDIHSNRGDTNNMILYNVVHLMRSYKCFYSYSLPHLFSIFLHNDMSKCKYENKSKVLEFIISLIIHFIIRSIFQLYFIILVNLMIYIVNSVWDLLPHNNINLRGKIERMQRDKFYRI